jgi:biopolymer transport protein ExbD/biopolymer transport protein TolR
MGMNVSSGSKKDAVTPTMNVTPLVDVVLVLLIIFMVVTPLLSKQFWLNLPKKDETKKEEPPPDKNDAIVLKIDSSGIVRINSNVVDRAELKDRLTRIFASRTDHVLFFDAADDAPYGLAVEIMDVARMGGATSIAILTEKTGS